MPRFLGKTEVGKQAFNQSLPAITVRGFKAFQQFAIIRDLAFGKRPFGFLFFVIVFAGGHFPHSGIG